MHAYLNKDKLLVFVAQTAAEEKRLIDAYAGGHLHFVCKAYARDQRTRLPKRRGQYVRKDTTLALRLFCAPSIQEWRVPRRRRRR